MFVSKVCCSCSACVGFKALPCASSSSCSHSSSSSAAVSLAALPCASQATSTGREAGPTAEMFMFSVSGRCCAHAMNCCGTPFSGSCCVRSSLSGTSAYSWHTLLRVCTSFMYSCRLTISACALLTCSMLRANRTTKVFCTCVVVGGSEVASSSGLAWARRMQLPPMPFSCSSLSPLPRLSLRHTGRPRQLSMRVPKDAFCHELCSRPSQSRFASAGGGMAISAAVRRHKLRMQVLQHCTVASSSPMPAQRLSNGFWSARHLTLFVCSSQVISGCRGCWIDEA